MRGVEIATESSASFERGGERKGMGLRNSLEIAMKKSM
jgi:hypothetical protein